MAWHGSMCVQHTSDAAMDDIEPSKSYEYRDINHGAVTGALSRNAWHTSVELHIHMHTRRDESRALLQRSRYANICEEPVRS